MDNNEENIKDNNGTEESNKINEENNEVLDVEFDGGKNDDIGNYLFFYYSGLCNMGKLKTDQEKMVMIHMDQLILFQKRN